MRLRRKVTLAFFAVSSVVSLVLALVIYRVIERQLTDDLRDRLRDITHIGAHAVDVPAYTRLLDGVASRPADDAERSPDYALVAAQLRAIRAADPALIQFAYLLAPSEGGAPRFVVDADVLDLVAAHATGKISHYGQRYEVAEIPLLADALARCEPRVEPDFVEDGEFQTRSVSAYVPLAAPDGSPLRDAWGRCLGVLGVDVTDAQVRDALAAMRRLQIELSIGAVAIALLASIVFGGVLTRPVLALSAVVNRFAARDFSARAGRVSGDEVGALAASFDAMAGALEQHEQRLQRQLADEKNNVALRDLQLAEAHQEVREANAPGVGRYTGTTLGGFRLGNVIGRGAMGDVYAGRDARGEACAVKVLATHLLDNEDALRRFQREAKAIAALTGPNVVRMLAVSPPDAAQPYLAMELLDGTDLGVLIKERPVRELAEVVAIVRAIADGLEVAHAAGVVHRDLKPANVFATRGGEWKILDFGVSKLFDGDATVTTGQLVGTPAYMAPEQARGGHIDHRVDLYALGVMIYRLLLGRPAVVPGDTPTMLHEVCYKMPPRPGVPAQVEAVLAVALAKDPADRFASARELADALVAAAAGALDAAVIARADAQLAKAPWGAWLSTSTANEARREAASDRARGEGDATESSPQRERTEVM